MLNKIINLKFTLFLSASLLLSAEYTDYEFEIFSLSIDASHNVIIAGTVTAGGFTTTGTWTFDEYTSGTVGITTVQDSGTTHVMIGMGGAGLTHKWTDPKPEECMFEIFESFFHPISM